MSRRLPHTPSSAIRSALRQCWLRSRERAEAIRRDGYTCRVCGKKQSRAKGKECRVEVHHLDGIEWADIITYIRENLLCSPERLITVCEKCHREEHDHQ